MFIGLLVCVTEIATFVSYLIAATKEVQSDDHRILYDDNDDDDDNVYHTCCMLPTVTQSTLHSHSVVWLYVGFHRSGTDEGFHSFPNVTFISSASAHPTH